MSATVLSVIADLRQRRLLPVAALLLVAVVALPLLALKSSAEPAVTPTAGQSASTAAPAGLPSPQQALSDKPLVSLAVLDGSSSDLGEFESKDPFKPIDQVSDNGASTDTSSGGSATADTGSGTGTGSNDTASTGGGSGGGGGSTGGGQTEQKQTTTTPKSDNDGGSNQNEGGATPQTEKKLTYAVDLTIRGPKGIRTYRGLPKLSLLPSQDNPLLVFLGVEDAGTKAVFLVDAKLKSVEGEGTCTPSPQQCATLTLAPGEEHVLANDQGQTWTIRIVEVRETSVAKAAAAARKAEKRRAREARRATTAVGDKPVPRFVPPMITDLFTGGRS